MYYTVEQLIHQLRQFDPSHVVILDQNNNANDVTADFVVFEYIHDFNEPDNLDLLDDVEWERDERPVVCLSAVTQDGT
jgi:hypothetical protein